MKRKSLVFRLMTYFLLVSLVPILGLSIYFYTSISRTLNANLSDQALESLERIEESFELCLDDYRHRSYEIATNEDILAVLNGEETVPTTEVYQQLYQAMRGTIYSASAHLISVDGRIRFSTHEFPERYDLSYKQNEMSMASTLLAVTKPTELLSERYINSRNDIILLNIVRMIADEEGKLLGYVIIDLFSTTLSKLCSERVFSDLVLIDSSTLKAFSLLHTDTYGNYSTFPALTEASTEFSSDPLLRSVRVSSSHIVAQMPIESTRYRLAGIIDTPPYALVLKKIFLISLIIMAASVAASLLFAYFVSKHVSSPVGKLVGAMKKVEEGSLAVQVPNKSDTVEIERLNFGFNEMVSKIRILIELTKEEERQLREAERKALQAQINPHFLYNTLYTIKAIATLHGEKQILEIVTSLGKLLRNSISSASDELPLSESLDLVRSYLTIVQIRFPGRLTYRINIEKGLEQFVTPKLIIQPFVENAVTHGLEPKIGEWKIRITIYASGGRTVVCIQDNGVGYEKSHSSLEEREHIGIENVRRRLALFYQEEADLKITSSTGVGTVVRMILPDKEN